MQMVDVHVPSTDERELTLTRYTQPEPELKLLLERLRLTPPAQKPPKITARVVQTFGSHLVQYQELSCRLPLESAKIG